MPKRVPVRAARAKRIRWPYSVRFDHVALPLNNPRFDAAMDAAMAHSRGQFDRRTGLRDGSRSELLAWWTVEFERVAGSAL